MELTHEERAALMSNAIKEWHARQRSKPDVEGCFLIVQATLDAVPQRATGLEWWFTMGSEFAKPKRRWHRRRPAWQYPSALLGSKRGRLRLIAWADKTLVDHRRRVYADRVRSENTRLRSVA